MTRIAYFQPFNGLSGDMSLGALLDAARSAPELFGPLDTEALTKALLPLGIGAFTISSRDVFRGAFRCTRLRVHVPGDADPREDEHGHAHEHPAPGDEPGPPHSHSHSHTHSHTHTHSHSHTHEGDETEADETEADRDASREGHSHSHDPAHAREVASHEGHRSLREILERIAGSGLPERVRENATTVFRQLGAAEAGVHGVDVEDVHFHEVGAVDSIVDIVGVCWLLDRLGVEEVHSSPVTVGTGFVRAAHGRIPLPAPATASLLRDIPIVQVDSRAELTTPTGAALLKGLSRSFGPLPPASIRAIGWGAGDDRPGPVPNALRIFLADADARTSRRGDTIVVLETNLDDMSPEWSGYLVEKLLDAGAYDVFLSPILMKKTRPAHQVTVLAPLEKEAALARLLFRHSTTFGVRRRESERWILDRQLEEIQTPWGVVRVKIGHDGDERVSVSPEYEDLRRAAESSGLSLRELHRRVLELHALTARDSTTQKKESLD